ncbi:MAG: FAD-binding protein, partial [Thermodesulfobacteriota bacterium]
LGERFMERYAPVIKDLAPRDIVSRAIVREVQEGRGIHGEDYVHLDLRGIGPERIRDRLWEIASFARTYVGVDPARDPIPVQPTCHYMMGGLPTDMDGRVLRDASGEAVPGLFAAGECACVSVHGANRLGCNSLLDLVVFGRRAGKAISNWIKEDVPQSSGDARDLESARSRMEMLFRAEGKERVPMIREELQRTMRDHCSVFRDQAGLEKARGKVAGLKERFKEVGISVRDRCFNMELVEALELGHLLDLAQVVVESALSRKESRGAHYREDYPRRDDQGFLVHTLAFQEGDRVRIGTKPVSITRFQPVERTY